MSNKNFKVITARPVDDAYQHPFYLKTSCPHIRVGDALRDRIDEWDPQNPILIDAPTGLGKTTFVYEDLLPRALSANQNILLISNRVALSVQQKRDIMKRLGSPLEDCLTDKGLREWEDFGSVRVLTYHRLNSFLKDPKNKAWINNIMYVVADEVHFFAADSTFNDKCDLYLNQITSQFCKSIRIYLTATPWDVAYLLAKAENDNYHNLARAVYYYTNGISLEKRRFYRYCFERDYSNYNLEFFQSDEVITEMINIGKNEKFLVFVDNKNKAEKLTKTLKTSVTYLDASRKDLPEWNDLLSEEKFESQVLISTSVLDCGVNINDPQLKNIIIYADNRTAIMQMAGRKRCKDNETVNLWIYDIPMDLVYKRNQKCQEYLDWEREFDSCNT